MITRELHYLLATLIWGIPGITITIKGIGAYSSVSQSQLWWLLLVTAFIVIAFFYIFRRVSIRYISRISTLPSKCHLFSTFPPRGWILLFFMMGLGLLIKCIPDVPLQFTASFYSGLGPMLLLNSLRFLFAMLRQ